MAILGRVPTVTPNHHLPLEITKLMTSQARDKHTIIIWCYRCYQPNLNKSNIGDEKTTLSTFISQTFVHIFKLSYTYLKFPCKYVKSSYTYVKPSYTYFKLSYTSVNFLPNSFELPFKSAKLSCAHLAKYNALFQTHVHICQTFAEICRTLKHICQTLVHIF